MFSCNGEENGEEPAVTTTVSSGDAVSTTTSDGGSGQVTTTAEIKGSLPLKDWGGVDFL